MEYFSTDLLHRAYTYYPAPVELWLKLVTEIIVSVAVVIVESAAPASCHVGRTSSYSL